MTFFVRIVKSSLLVGTLGGLLTLKKRFKEADCVPFFIIVEFPKLKKWRKPNLPLELRNDTFDVIVVGGGATGCGVAYAASTRGLKVGLVERNDFGSGTSSKSTKLIHGGVRYLQKAILHLDKEEVVSDSLHERTLLFKNCPNMVTPVPILLPCSNPLDFMFKRVGLMIYDLLSGDASLMSKSVKKSEIERIFPFLKLGRWSRGILYYDGQFDDARMDLTVIRTAVINGASVCNYVNVENILKELFDKETQERFRSRARFVVNATGPYIDSIRKIKNPQNKAICVPSTGVHLSMPTSLTQHGVGILINEPNNRVLFMLPWEGTTIVGTSDQPSTLQEKPIPTETEVESILHRLAVVTNETLVNKQNVKSCWSGIRPLVIDPNSRSCDTSSISRHHLIEKNDNFINVSGGKWTIFHRMGEDVVDEILGDKYQDNQGHESLDLVYSAGWTPDVTKTLVDEYKVPQDVANHLSHAFGVEALEIVKMKERLNRLHPDYPYTEEELVYICKNEFVCSLEDIIGRRTRLAFIDVPVTFELLEKISKIAKAELNWSDKRVESELAISRQFLQNEMGFNILHPNPTTLNSVV